MRSPLPHQLPYRPDVDGLRAVAVLLVVAFHARPEKVAGGFIGVDVFFVISGFLISALLLDSAQSGTFSIVDFYSRRFRRILPALIIVLSAVAAAGWLLLLPQEFVDLGKLIISGVSFVPNIQLWTEAGYFAGNPNMRPLLHLWSLGVEEQFYLVWPWLVLAFWHRRMQWLIVLLAAASFVCCVLFLQRFPSAAFYFPVTRLWELLAGAYLAWLERRHLHAGLGTVRELPAWARETLAVVGSVLILGSALYLNPSLPFPGWWALPAVAGTAFLIAAGSRAWLNRHALSQPLVVWFGLISYPLYLWHWPMLVFLRIEQGREPTDGAKYAAVLLAILLAWITYQFVERPIRSQRSGRRRRLIVPSLLGALGLLGLFSGTVIATEGLPIRYPPALRTFLTYRYDSTSGWRHQCFLQASQLPGDWKQSACIESGTTPLVILWGDSHAAELRPGLERLHATRKFRIGEMTAAGCAPFVGMSVPGRPFCRTENDMFLREVRDLKPETVVLGAWWYDTGFKPLKNTLEMLKAAGVKRIVVVGPTPEWSAYLPALLVRRALQDGFAIPKSLGPDAYFAVPEKELKTLVETEGAQYISAMEAICPDQHCVTMTKVGPQYVTFFDEAHFTEAGSELLTRRVANVLLP